MKKLRVVLTLFFVFALSFVVSAKELPGHDNVSVNKIWTINLYYPIDARTLSGITVKDSNGNLVDIDKMTSSDGKKITVEPKCGAWGRGLDYTLEIKDIKSAAGQSLKEPITMKFSTEGKTFTPSGDYADDEQYVYDNFGRVTWEEDKGATDYRCYYLGIYKGTDGILNVCLNTDTFGIGNILTAPTATKAMDSQIEAIYSYMKNKYPNENIRVGLFFQENLNKYPGDTDPKNVTYDEKTGKYSECLMLACENPDGSKYFITENK